MEKQSEHEDRDDPETRYCVVEFIQNVAFRERK